MKRIICILLFFVIISVPILTSCTCYCGEYTCRGWGYEYILCHMQVCGCSLSERKAAVEGVDYSKPEIVGLTGNSFIFRMDAYSDLQLNMEICIVQDSVLLYSCVYEGAVTAENDLRFTVLFDRPGWDVESHVMVYHHNRYSDDGGDMYVIINKFEAYKR